MTRHCPVCWQPVTPTGARKSIPFHFDSIGREECPATGNPMRITLPHRPDRDRATASDIAGTKKLRRLQERLAAA